MTRVYADRGGNLLTHYGHIHRKTRAHFKNQVGSGYVFQRGGMRRRRSVLRITATSVQVFIHKLVHSSAGGYG